MSRDFTTIETLIKNATPPVGSSAKLQKEHQSFLDRVERLGTNRGHAFTRRKELDAALSTDGRTESGVPGFDCEQIREADLQLMTDELGIRADLDPFLIKLSAARHEVTIRAQAALKEHEMNLIKTLVGVGYHDPTTSLLSRYKVVPIFLQLHPESHRLLNAVRTARGETVASPRADNKRAMEAIRANLRAAGRLLAGVPIG